jgi:hypothetical protein
MSHKTNATYGTYETICGLVFIIFIINHRQILQFFAALR